MTVLSQMAGILATSLFIMLILAFVFWFLIHTMLKQKTLDEMKSDFTNNITHELKTPIAVAYAATDSLLNYGMLQHPDKEAQVSHHRPGAVADAQRIGGADSVDEYGTTEIDASQYRGSSMKEVIEPVISQHQLKVKSGVRTDKR